MYTRHLTCIKEDTTRDLVMTAARKWIRQSFATHRFTDLETSVLKNFFSNLEGRVFFIHSLPGNITATIVSMYSRMKNPRGLRGVFVDSFLPGILAAEAGLLDQFDANVEKCLAHYQIKNLDDLRTLLEKVGKPDLVSEFAKNTGTSPEWISALADSAKAKKFLFMWLDKYGHNSIARMGSVVFCCEDISVLAAKSLEWTRPGVGFVELSTRYVNMEKAGMYPIAQECGLLGGNTQEIDDLLSDCLETYKHLEGGAELTGVVPTFFRESYRDLCSEKDLETGIFGETCDLLGNILPTAVLTSVGIVASGETFPGIIKHLLLDNKPETVALAELIVEESAKVGANQFIRHETPNKWDLLWWPYVPIENFIETAKHHPSTHLAWDKRHHPPKEFVKAGMAGIDPQALQISLDARSDHDKLPAQFEGCVASFEGLVSFRSWRDLQRQGFSTHHRSLLTPHLGFYQYDKTPLPEEITQSFNDIAQRSKQLYDRLLIIVPPEMLEYLMPMGFRVGCYYGANIRQHEFCIWQRTKYSVNDEVRRFFLGVDTLLGDADPEWRRISRTNRTPAFVFARGEEIPLPEKTNSSE